MKKMIDGIPTTICSVAGNPPVEMFMVAEEVPKQKQDSLKQRKQRKLEKEKSEREQQQRLLDDINSSVNFETTKSNEGAVLEKINAFIGGE